MSYAHYVLKMYELCLENVCSADTSDANTNILIQSNCIRHIYWYSIQKCLIRLTEIPGEQMMAERILYMNDSENTLS